MTRPRNEPAVETTCSVCRDRIIGTYYMNLWQRPYHRCHRTCECCVRPIREGRRRLCPSCDGTVVQGTEAARILIDRVRRALHEQRGVTVPDSLEAKLVLLVGGDQQRLGQAVLHRAAYGDGVATTSATIHMKRGLPAVQFAGVAAHELAHVWLWVNEVRPTRVVDEGIAELCAFWTLGRIGGATAAALQAMTAANRDPTYGTG